jgi:hypothetical protein
MRFVQISDTHLRPPLLIERAPPAREAGMDRNARAPARPPFAPERPGLKPRVERDTARQAQLL